MRLRSKDPYELVFSPGEAVRSLTASPFSLGISPTINLGISLTEVTRGLQRLRLVELDYEVSSSW